MAQFPLAARYATCGIIDQVGSDLQTVLWNLIDERKADGALLDYRQIFELTMEFAFGNIYQKVVHLQKVPAFSQTFYYPNIERPLHIIIWVIDSNEYATMLLPEEY
jgi:hypothetical protein